MYGYDNNNNDDEGPVAPMTPLDAIGIGCLIIVVIIFIFFGPAIMIIF